jgi:hypothetical protein
MTVRPTRTSLAKVGVELVYWKSLRLKCITCGTEWQPFISPARRLENNWWACRENPEHTKKNR